MTVADMTLGMIAKNSLLEWRDNKANLLRTERVLYVEVRDEDDVWLYVIDRDPENGQALPLCKPLTEYQAAFESNPKELYFAEEDKWLRNVPPKFIEIPDEPVEQYKKRKKKYDDGLHRWNVIENYLSVVPDMFDPLMRGDTLKFVHEETGITPKTLLKWLRWFWQGGMTRSAVFDHFEFSGAGGQSRTSEEKLGRKHILSQFDEDNKYGENLEEEDRANIKEAIEIYYLKPRRNGKKPRLKDAYKKMLITHYLSHKKIVNNLKVPVPKPRKFRPSFDQFRDQYYRVYLNREPNSWQKAKESREGSKNFNTKLRGNHDSSSGKKHGPGAQFQIDATVADVYLRSALNPNQIIGRPVIYIISDTFSHAIVSFHVTLEGPSWKTATSAIANLALNRVLWAKALGYPIKFSDWVHAGFPSTFVADNGELKNTRVGNILDFLLVEDFIFLPPWRPDWKGIVEADFDFLNDEVIAWTPGYVYHRGERGENNYRLDGRLTLYDMRQLVLSGVLKHNNYRELTGFLKTPDMIKDGLRPYPGRIWHWGIDKRMGNLIWHPYQYVRMSLLPKEEAVVTRDGILLRKLYYECETSLVNDWASKARNGRWKVWVAADPHNPRDVFLCNDDLSIKEPCWLKRPYAMYAGYDWYELQAFLHAEKIQSAAEEDENLEGMIQLDTFRDSVINNALLRATDPDISASDQIRDIRENRAAEIEYERDMQTINPLYQQAPQVKLQQAQLEAPTDTYTAKGLEFLRQNKKENSNE